MSPAKQETIARILAAAREPCPQIVKLVYMVLPDGSRSFTPGMYPAGIDPAALVKRECYAYLDRCHGVTYGQRYQSREEAEAAYRVREDRRAAEFRAQLEKMTPRRLNEAAAYWLKATT